VKKPILYVGLLGVVVAIGVVIGIDLAVVTMPLSRTAYFGPRLFADQDNNWGRADLEAESQPQPPDVATRSLAGAADQRNEGLLLYRIPERMFKGRADSVEVRIGAPDAKRIWEDKFGRHGTPVPRDVELRDTMSVSLVGEPAGAFSITPQFTTPEQDLSSADYLTWTWLVTPLEHGVQKLSVNVSGKDRGGSAGSKLYANDFDVSVRVDWPGVALATVWWGLQAFLSALIGIFTHDHWWPTVRRLVGLSKK